MNTRKRKASIQDTKYTQPDNKNMRYTRMQKIHQDQTHKEKDIEYIEPDSKKSRHIRMQKMQKKRKREEENNSDDMQRALKQQCPNTKNNSDDMQIPLKQRCLDIDHRHLYLSSSHGMVSFTPEYIQHLKETYNERSYLGLPEYNCKYCNAMFWYHEQSVVGFRCQLHSCIYVIMQRNSERDVTWSIVDPSKDDDSLAYLLRCTSPSILMANKQTKKEGRT